MSGMDRQARTETVATAVAPEPLAELKVMAGRDVVLYPDPFAVTITEAIVTVETEAVALAPEPLPSVIVTVGEA